MPSTEQQVSRFPPSAPRRRTLLWGSGVLAARKRIQYVMNFNHFDAAKTTSNFSCVITPIMILKREERALREHIGSFRAADRLAREDVHKRDL